MMEAYQVTENDKLICGCTDNENMCICIGNYLCVYDYKNGIKKEMFFPQKYSKIRAKGSNAVLVKNQLLIASEKGPYLLIIDITSMKIEEEICYGLDKTKMENDEFFMVNSGLDVFFLALNGKRIIRMNICNREVTSVTLENQVARLIDEANDDFIRLVPYDSICNETSIVTVVRGKRNDYLLKIDKRTSQIVGLLSTSISGGKHAISLYNGNILIRDNRDVIMFNLDTGNRVQSWELPPSIRTYARLKCFDNKLVIIGSCGDVGEIDINTNTEKWNNLGDFKPIFINCNNYDTRLVGMKGHNIVSCDYDGSNIQIIVERMKSRLELFVDYICS